MDEQGIIDRLMELAQLKEGWLDGRGREINPHLIAEVREILLSEPRVYPMEDGGIEVVWGEYCLAIEIAPDGYGPAWASIGNRTLREVED